MADLKGRLNMMDDIKCPICNMKTVQMSRTAKLSANARLGWECDSTMKILGWKEADVQLRLCWQCFHVVVYPKFETSLLYDGERSKNVKKHFYETYFPGKAYEVKNDVLEFNDGFAKAMNEFNRFAKISKIISRKINGSIDKLDEIRILDWGGGNGYVSAMLSKMITIVTKIPSTNYIYDYVEFEQPQGEKVGIKHLEQMPKFQIVVLSHVLEHSHDPVQTIRQAASFLEKDGLLICEVPDEVIKIASAILKNKVRLSDHVCVFSSRSLQKVLEQASLCDIYAEYCGNMSYHGYKMASILGVGKFSGEVKRSKPASSLFEMFYLFIRFFKAYLLRLRRGNLSDFH